MSSKVGGSGTGLSTTSQDHLRKRQSTVHSGRCFIPVGGDAGVRAEAGHSVFICLIRSKKEVQKAANKKRVCLVLRIAIWESQIPVKLK